MLLSLVLEAVSAPSFARTLKRAGYHVVLASRNPDNVKDFAATIGADTYGCDATQPDQVAALPAAVDAGNGDLDVVLYNASARAHGPVTSWIWLRVASSLAISAYGGFLVGQQAAQRMRRAGRARSCLPVRQQGQRLSALFNLRDGQIRSAWLRQRAGP